ncbi:MULTISPECIES: hypothetical protein [Pseudomonas fluorescens group]|jgi:hypothetical protein|uniref:Uncharacterized protein n=1 Tax=Pseudomonas poae TaxID=200451 RepID=A0A7Z1GXW9_9PSED|nr:MULTISPECIES: hypothetical protein [Pseudomonas fluorescens group]PFG72278.1 hypothetical protein DM05_2666 [Pseudomonas poae]
MSYYDIPSLSNIYLEDSYVLSVREGKGSLVFELEAVLTEKHPKYKKPQEGEIYCYRRVLLRFLNADSFEWLDRNFVAYADALGEFDCGNIDSFFGCEGGYELTGDWGRVAIKGGL